MPDIWKNNITGYGEMSPDELIKLANPDNPTIHTKEQEGVVEGSLDEIGWIQDIILNKTTNRVLDGHLRIKLALAKGVPSVPVKYVTLTEEQEALALTVINPTAGMGGYDPEKLKVLFGRISTESQNLKGFLGKLAETYGGNGKGNSHPEPGGVSQTEAEKYQEVWRVKQGDVWELGRHKIACLDSLDQEVVKSLVGDSVAMFVWADPPYGIEIVAANGYVGGGEAYDIPFGGRKNKGYVGGGARIKASPGFYPIESWGKHRVAKGLGSSDGAKPFGSEKVRGSVGASNLIDVGKYFPVIGDDTIETAVQSSGLLLSLYPDACHVWWGGNYYAHTLPPSPGWIVWDKDNTGNFADCELAWTNQHRAARIFEHRWNGMLKASEQGQRRVHPTQKPVMLAQEVFKEFGESNDVIFDPFLGSGISVLAAEALNDGRQVIGCELAPEYISVSIQRWVDLTGKQPKLLSG